MNTVKFLLECGVDLNSRDLYGFTPLKNAEIFENREMMELLQSVAEKTQLTSKEELQSSCNLNATIEQFSIQC